VSREAEIIANAVRQASERTVQALDRLSRAVEALAPPRQMPDETKLEETGGDSDRP